MTQISRAARALVFFEGVSKSCLRWLLFTLSSPSPLLCFWPGVGIPGLWAGNGVAFSLRLEETRVLTLWAGVLAMQASLAGFNSISIGPGFEGVASSAGCGFEGVASSAGFGFEGVASSAGFGFEGVASFGFEGVATSSISDGLGLEGVAAFMALAAGGGMLRFCFVGVSGKFRAATFSFLARAASKAFRT